MTREEQYRGVLEALIDTIDATGGVARNEKGETVPVGDPDWVDLGSVYERACAALGRDPRWSEDNADPAGGFMSAEEIMTAVFDFAENSGLFDVKEVEEGGVPDGPEEQQKLAEPEERVGAEQEESARAGDDTPDTQRGGGEPDGAGDPTP